MLNDVQERQEKKIVEIGNLSAKKTTITTTTEKNYIPKWIFSLSVCFWLYAGHDSIQQHSPVLRNQQQQQQQQNRQEYFTENDDEG